MLLDAVDYLRRGRTEQPEEIALILAGPSGADERISWRRLVDEAEGMAARLNALGARPGGRVMVALGASMEHFAAVAGAWMAGQLVLPIPPQMTQAQRKVVADQFRPLAVCDAEGLHRTLIPAEPKGQPLPRPPSRYALLSGGTTGDPKVIMRRHSWTEQGEVPSNFAVLYRHGDVTLVCTPLYGMGFQAAWESILRNNQTVVLRRFSPAAWLRVAAAYSVTFTRMVPTQMKWIAESASFPEADLSALRVLHHTAAACPADVKRTWLARLSPNAVYESYSSREDVLTTLISGEEWLAYPGSVGRVDQRTVRILDDNLTELPVGQIGRIFMRPHDGVPKVEGRDAAFDTTKDGKFVSLGDMGRIDLDGYLYLVDRVSEMFTTGGLNVYPSQIERELADFQGVRDCVVLGEAHADLGHIAAAYVWLKDGFTLDEVVAFAEQRLAGPDLPRSFRQVTGLPRDASGKVARRRVASDLKVERSWPTSEAAL